MTGHYAGGLTLNPWPSLAKVLFIITRPDPVTLHHIPGYSRVTGVGVAASS